MFGFMKKLFSREKAIDGRAFFGVDWPGGFVDAFRRVAKPSKDAMLKEYRGFAYICANYNARAVFSTKLRLLRRISKGEKSRWSMQFLNREQTAHICKSHNISLATGERIAEITNHNALSLLQNPNPHMSGFRLLEFNQLYQEMTGEAAIRIIYVEFGASKIPVGLYLLQPQYLHAVEDEETGFISHYDYGHKEKIKLMPDEVLNFKLPNLRSPYLNGYSPLAGVFEDVNILDLYKATEAAILSNEGRPDVLVSGKDGLGDIERLEKRFATKFRRGGKGGIMFVEDDLSVTPLSWAPKDLAFLSVGDRAREIIALAYGIPPVLLSSQGTTQYDVDNTVSNRHIINAIKPRLERNLDVLNSHFINLFDPSGTLFFAYDDPSVVNKEQQLEEDTKLVAAGIVLPNEVRVTRGYEPKEWGDKPAGMYQQSIGGATEEIEEPSASTEEAAQDGNIQATALNGTQIASLLQIVEAVTTGALTPEAAELVIQASFPLLDPKLLSQLTAELDKAKKVPTVGTTPSEPEHKCKSHKAHPLPNGKELAKVLKTHFAKQRKYVLDSLKSKAKTKGLPKKFVNMADWDREMYEDCQPLVEMYFKKQYQITAKDIVTRAGISNDVFNVKNPHTAKAVKNLALRFCEETNATTSQELTKALDDLRDSLAEGLTEGERMSQLQDRVEAIFDNAEGYRAERIAQTESSRAHHEGLRQAAKDSGVVKGFQLLPSSACCDLCQQIAEEVGEIGLDDSFHTDDSESTPDEYREKFVPVHPSCECTAVCVLTETENEAE